VDSIYSSAVNPLVSIIVPCINEDPKVLIESLASIRDQSFRNFECIVIDESTDTYISNVCESFCKSDARFVYIHPKERVGLSASLNIGIGISKGDFIARFDSDDICSRGRLALQVEFMNENLEIGIVGSAIDLIDDSGALIGRRMYPSDHSAIKRAFIFSNALAHPTVMFRKTVLLMSGGAYDASFLYAEDLEFWLRLLNCGIIFANISEPLVKYRQQNTNRNKLHWKFNIKARIKNFSSPYRFSKIFGILGIALWVYLPNKIKIFLFKLIHLEK
jgi:glycosyltransferase involved in cell wall biosynthesis